MIVASGQIGVKVRMELYQRALGGRGMPGEWKTSVVMPIFEEKGGVMSCGSYRAVKLLEHAMKIVERVLERRIRTPINLNKMQFTYMPGERNSGCDIHCKKNAGGKSKEGQQVVCVFC